MTSYSHDTTLTKREILLLRVMSVKFGPWSGARGFKSLERKGMVTLLDDASPSGPWYTITEAGREAAKP